MNPQQAENLRILIRHMESNVVRTLDMGRYFNPCGTPACALGEAATIPALLARGLVVHAHEDGKLACPDNEAEVFGLYDEAKLNRLFGLSGSCAWRRSRVTPQEWAAEARKVLAEHGYAMDEPKPVSDFARFMERVVEPVEVSA